MTDRKRPSTPLSDSHSLVSSGSDCSFSKRRQPLLASRSQSALHIDPSSQASLANTNTPSSELDDISEFKVLGVDYIEDICFGTV